MEWSLIFADYQLFLQGIGTTLNLVVVSLLIGGLLAIPLSLIRAYRHPILNGPVWLYTYFMRSTPLIVQTYLIYYGLAQFEVVRESMFWPFFREAYWCALLAFSLNTAAYTTEIFRGVIETTPLGEIEAAKASGMSSYQRIRRIVLPSAFRRVLPVYSNEVIFMLHSSVIASTITLVDILGAGRTLNAKYYLAYEGFISAAVLYMLGVLFISFVFKLLERKYHAHVRVRMS
ncbi:MAG: amino acid ABC transporter permease [Marinomonas sp.]|nr:MAG: amino acid ABC transporter permease [Marinomonas sp.]